MKGAPVQVGGCTFKSACWCMYAKSGEQGLSFGVFVGYVRADVSAKVPGARARERRTHDNLVAAVLCILYTRLFAQIKARHIRTA